MKNYKPYRSLYKEQTIDELVEWFKSRFTTLNDVNECSRFKALSPDEKRYVLEQLRASGLS